MASRASQGTGVPQGTGMASSEDSPSPLKMTYDAHALPVDLLTQFWFSLRDGKLRSGRNVMQARIAPEEAGLFATPYAGWAPAPYNVSEVRSVSALHRSTMALSGLGNVSAMILATSTVVDKDLHNMKSRLWEGMPPMTGARWKQRRLHELDNVTEACQHLCAVVNAFEYINLPHSQKRVRDAWNGIWDACHFFELALNMKRRSQNLSAVSVTALWEEFMVDYISTISDRAHGWVLGHVNRLREAQLRLLGGTSHDLGPRSYSDEQKAILDVIHDLDEITIHADCKIMIPLYGYRIQALTSAIPFQEPAGTRYNGSGPIRSCPLDMSTRVAAYWLRCRHLARAALMQQGMELLQLGQSGGYTSSPEDIIISSRVQANEYNKARLELRGPAQQQGDEMWVSLLKHRMVGDYRAWGYIAYRLCYTHSDEEWQLFLRQFKEQVTNWGEGVEGVSSIKPMCRIRWLDGREYGIAEGDVEAAKRHYRDYDESPACQALLTAGARTFLVADEATINSFIKPSTLGSNPFISESDLRSFVLVATAEEPTRPTSDDLPGFDGTARVLGSVLFDDLWAGLLRRSFQLKNLWPLVATHPRQVYVGPTVPVEKAAWAKLGVLSQTVVQSFLKWQNESS